MQISNDFFLQRSSNTRTINLTSHSESIASENSTKVIKFTFHRLTTNSVSLGKLSLNLELYLVFVIWLYSFNVLNGMDRLIFPLTLLLIWKFFHSCQTWIHYLVERIYIFHAEPRKWNVCIIFEWTWSWMRNRDFWLMTQLSFKQKSGWNQLVFFINFESTLSIILHLTDRLIDYFLYWVINAIFLRFLLLINDLMTEIVWFNIQEPKV